MYCPNCERGLLMQCDSGEPDYEPLEEWYCIDCHSYFDYDDLFWPTLADAAYWEEHYGGAL